MSAPSCYGIHKDFPTGNQVASAPGSPAPGRAYVDRAIGVPLTATQSLGSKSGQVMLETEEMSWLLIFMQLKKVHLSLGFFCISPGCGRNRIKMSKSVHQRLAKEDLGDTASQKRGPESLGK